MTDLHALFKLSRVESARLGAPVHRVDIPVDVEPIDVAALMQLAKKMGQLAIIRCDVLNFVMWRALMSAGVGLFDILEEFRGPTEVAMGPSVLKQDDDIIAADALDSKDFSACLSLCGEAFQGIENHYSLDSRIPRDWIRGSYEDWLAQLTKEGSQDSGAWIRLDNGSVIGFVVWRLAESACLDISLYATRSSFQGRGIATELIRFAAQQALKSGKLATHVRLATQAWNMPSKATALRVGLMPYRTQLTFHLWS